MEERVRKRLSEVSEFTISVALFDDLVDLISLADNGLETLPNYSMIKRSRSRMAESFSDMIKNPNKICLIARVEGVCVGAMAAYIDVLWFSRELYSENIFIYVVPRWRGSNIASTLLSIYREWAKARGVSKILLESSSGIKPLASKRFFERQGFETLGYRLAWENRDG